MKGHLNVQLAAATHLSVVPAFPGAQPAPLRRPRSRLAEKKQPGILRPEESPEILRGQTFQRSEARRGKFQGWMGGILGNRTGDGEGSKKAARTRRVRRSPEHRRLADVFGVRHKEEQALRGWMDPIPVRDGGPSGQRPPLRLSISRNPQLRQNGQHRNQRRSHGLPPFLHQAYSFQHSAEGDPICPRAILTLDRKSTRLNSSHLRISYAVFCLKKKKEKLRRRVGIAPGTSLFRMTLAINPNAYGESVGYCIERYYI